jgi:hypothetical protein
MNVAELSINQRKKLLQDAVVQLKKEFIGIDGIIDEISDSILPWWLFPQHQLRPLIINLWGMTGSGKTALVSRLAELIHYANLLMRFDMGEFGASSSFLKWTLTRQLTQFNEAAPIILLDEFQFAKTKDENGKEVNNINLRIIWDLLDSGKLLYEPDGVGYYTMRAKKAMQFIRNLIKIGTTIHKGIVTHHVHEAHEIFTDFMFGYQDMSIDRVANPNPFKPEEIFISDTFCTGVHDMNTNNHASWKEVAEAIKELDSLEDLHDMIADIYDRETSFKKMDLSKSLIFVVGNLDEAFVMSNNINPDIDADEFRRHTQKINIADIKKALQNRFRNEQIARLGNLHLVYHAFSHKNFEDLIVMHLGFISTLVKSKFKFRVKFTKSVHELLYAEGVFPTQGVRPVISTIRNIIESNIAKIILHKEEKAKLTDNILWDYEDEYYTIYFYEKKRLISKLKLKTLQKINSLRKSTKNDLQALVAVHEAGHAVAAMYISKIVPEYVITKTVDTDSAGFTYTVLPEDIVTYQLLVEKIKIYLGGYVAEQVVFGKSLNTTGVSEDLKQVSILAQQISRDYGMYSLPAKHNIHVYGGLPYQFTFTAEMEESAKNLVLNCLADVESCLNEHKDIFLEISHYLSDHSRIEKNQLIEFDKNYTKNKGTAPTKFVNKDNYYQFRKKLIDAYKKNK